MAPDAGPLGVAMIGTGMVARTHLLAIRDARVPLRLISVLSRNPGRARGFADDAAKVLGHEVGVSEDLQEIAGDDRVDIALVLTPPDAPPGRDRTVGAPRARPFSSKSPWAARWRRRREVVALCEAVKVPLGVVFQHRMREASVAATDLVAGGALGALGLAEIAVPWWREQAYYDEPGRGTYARDGGGVLISQAIHTIDLALSLTGPVSAVTAMTRNDAAAPDGGRGHGGGRTAFRKRRAGVAHRLHRQFPRRGGKHQRSISKTPACVLRRACCASNGAMA